MFPKLDPILHSELRLAVMSILIGVDEADFTYLKKQTGATSGNLSVQIDKLMAVGYITVEKGFKGKVPHTTHHSGKRLQRKGATHYLQDYHGWPGGFQQICGIAERIPFGK